MNTVVKLSVHKNNSLQRKRKALRKDAVKQMKTCVNNPDIAGYAVVSWDASGEYHAGWNISGDSKILAHDMPRYVKDVLRMC